MRSTETGDAEPEAVVLAVALTQSQEPGSEPESREAEGKALNHDPRLMCSEEVQIKGRTARQGKKGSFSLVLNAEDLACFSISHEEVSGIPRVVIQHEAMHLLRAISRCLPL